LTHLVTVILRKIAEVIPLHIRKRGGLTNATRRTHAESSLLLLPLNEILIPQVVCHLGQRGVMEKQTKWQSAIKYCKKT